MLLKQNLDPNKCNNKGQNAVMLLFENEGEQEHEKFDPISTLNIFLKYKNKVKLSHKDDQGRTLLHYACRRGSTISAMILITEHGLDPTAKDMYKISPFSYAMLKGNIFVILKQ